MRAVTTSPKGYPFERIEYDVGQLNSLHGHLEDAADEVSAMQLVLRNVTDNLEGRGQALEQAKAMAGDVAATCATPAARRTRKRRRALGVLALALTGVMTMTGCGTAEPAPTGDALYADAEQTYMDYREFVNGVQSVLSTGPWIVGQIGDYGMQPDSCDNGNGYQFNLGRRLTMELADREQNADAIEQYLTDAGVTPSRRTLGDGSDSLIQIAVADERGFELLLIEFRKNGNAQISAATACRPGNAHDLSDMLFGEEVFLGGYLPSDVESPTDPLFFGITPGDPQFVRETLAPTDTPAP